MGVLSTSNWASPPLQQHKLTLEGTYSLPTKSVLEFGQQKAELVESDSKKPALRCAFNPNASLRLSGHFVGLFKLFLGCVRLSSRWVSGWGQCQLLSMQWMWHILPNGGANLTELFHYLSYVTSLKKLFIFPNQFGLFSTQQV